MFRICPDTPPPKAKTFSAAIAPTEFFLAIYEPMRRGLPISICTALGLASSNGRRVNLRITCVHVRNQRAVKLHRSISSNVDHKTGPVNARWDTNFFLSSERFSRGQTWVIFRHHLLHNPAEPRGQRFIIDLPGHRLAIS